MSKQRCKLSLLETFLDLKVCRLVGGVLLVFALAFIPNSVSALTTGTDYYANFANAGNNLYFGCNTVVSSGGYFVLGNRGSLLSNSPTISENYPCGYRYEDGQYDYHPNWYDTSTPQNKLTGGGSNSWINNPNYLQGWTYPTIVSNSLQEGSYIGANYHTVLHSMRLGWTNANHDFNIIPASNGDTLYDSNLFFAGINIADGTFTASIPDIEFEYLFKGNAEMSAEDKNQLYQDIWEHAITGFGSPKDYLEDTVYNEIKTQYNITNEADWERNNFHWYLAYLPRYSQSWSFDGYVNIWCGTRCQSVYPSDLMFAREYGMDHEDAYIFDYLAISPAYDNQNSYVDNFYNGGSLTIMCLSSACRSSFAQKSAIVAERHNQEWNGWTDPAQNPAQSWFNVFDFGVLFPFQSFFTSFTNDRCVDIPIIASWIHSPQNQYCTWWSNDIRNTLTPVFSSFGLLILFGFIVHWLSGRSSNAFRDNDTTRIKDRF